MAFNKFSFTSAILRTTRNQQQAPPNVVMEVPGRTLIQDNPFKIPSSIATVYVCVSTERAFHLFRHSALCVE